MTDVIRLRGIRAYGHHGVFDFEREAGQEFFVDIALYFSARRAAASDDVADTIDYGAVADRVAAIVSGDPVNLIETLSHRIADAILEDRRVRAAEVTVHKPQAPITPPFEDVSVTIVRERHPQ